MPAQFSQVAADILAQKYFRKAGVPARLKKVEETTVPSFLWRSVADEAELAKLPESERYGSERDARQVFDRLAGTWTYWGWKVGYFKTPRKTPVPSMTSSAYMLATRASHPIRRNGSTPAFTGPMASTAPARAFLCRSRSPAS